MNVFNRIVVILLALLLLIGAVIILLVTYGVISAEQALPGGLANTPFGQWVSSFAQMGPNSTLLTTVVALVVALLSLIIFLYEIRPGPSAPSTIVVREDGLGTVSVRASSVRDLILHTASTVPEVLQIYPHVDMRPDGVNIRCRTSLTPEANVPEVSSLLQERIKDSVERYLGMTVSSVAVDAQLEPLSDVPARSAAPQPVRRQLR
jgi:hypothetical protein